MPQVNACQSALFIGDEDGAVAVLVVGGNGGTGKEAELLTSSPRRTRRDRDKQGNPWRWQQLSPMQRVRPNRPGLLRLGNERVLVVGGAWRSRTAELLQLPRSDSDRGVWTLLHETMTQEFAKTFLANSNGRILAFGESFVKHVRQ